MGDVVGTVFVSLGRILKCVMNFLLFAMRFLLGVVKAVFFLFLLVLRMVLILIDVATPTD